MSIYWVYPSTRIPVTFMKVWFGIHVLTATGGVYPKYIPLIKYTLIISDYISKFWYITQTIHVQYIYLLNLFT